MEYRNPVLERAARSKGVTKSHKRAPKQEREVAHRIGGLLTPASGAKDVKGDVRLKRVARIECKTTKNKSFSVTREMVAKLEDEASLSGEMPIFIIEFIDPDTGRPQGELAVCPTWVLDTLQQE